MKQSRNSLTRSSATKDTVCARCSVCTRVITLTSSFRLCSLSSSTAQCGRSQLSQATSSTLQRKEEPVPYTPSSSTWRLWWHWCCRTSPRTTCTRGSTQRQYASWNLNCGRRLCENFSSFPSATTTPCRADGFSQRLCATWSRLKRSPRSCSSPCFPSFSTSWCRSSSSLQSRSPCSTSFSPQYRWPSSSCTHSGRA